ncbi:hypothetical protein F511_06014 [Dorcoceras hygrometricum]|uniref:Sorting nexin-13 n=1 Tax=Dorcoceras hygrometricum TaxID=472368 RepID=A0A2Z7AXL8_9LAMI|nr:hypothetical protein F511_06014 [Dorcoceras hygrometricum]
MSSQMPTVTVRDLVDEAKKRIVILFVCVVGLSYLMSLTSSSVLVNLPAATFLIIFFRYLSLDFDMRRKSATYKSRPTADNPEREHFNGPSVVGETSDWKKKVNSPIVEEALDHFTRHIISEWVTDLWYSRITTDRQVPEELVLIMNGVLAEISSRMRNVNILDLLTRDTINLLCSQLELFRATKTKIEVQQSRCLTVEERDFQLTSVLAADNKLHPALFSAEAEHKVLQHVMNGVILFTFKPEDLQCSLFRYITRELLACVVIRPVINLANPRFINERIESLIISANKTAVVGNATHLASQSINGSIQVSSEDISESIDPSINGVELVKLRNGHKKDIFDGRDIQLHKSGEAFGGSRKNIDSLAPEHLDNIWEKGRNYKTKGDTDQLADPVPRNFLDVSSNTMELPKQKKNELEARGSSLDISVLSSGCDKHPGDNDTSIHDNSVEENQASVSLCEEEYEDKSLPSEEVESGSSSHSDDEDTSIVTGLDTPGIKVWDGKNRRNFSHIHHPLETLDSNRSIKPRKGHLVGKRLHRINSAKKRSRSSVYNGHLWQEGERTSFLLGEGQDVLNSTDKPGDSSDDGETELLGRAFSEATASPSLSTVSLPGNHNLAVSSATNSVTADSFFKLKCEVFGANIVKSGSKTFTVYSISVTDVNNNSWSIKRRFQHFEELHRRLKEFPEYHLHLPPKHYLSTGLDVFVIQERCTLLDQYLKKLLQLPAISCSIEVWDFLSVDSQIYIFSDSLSIIETFPVGLNGAVYEKNKGHGKNAQPASDPVSSIKKNFRNDNQQSEPHIKGDHGCDDSRLKARDQSLSSRKPENDVRRDSQESNGDFNNSEPKHTLSTRNMERIVNGDRRATPSADATYVSADATLPIEWVPPNLSVPLLDLVEVILQLKAGGWIRRNVFWVVKQVLQLGMGDAFDDWLIGKIQLLRQGSVVASGIRRLDMLLWPDGIFITKHPRRQRPQPAIPVQNSPGDQPSTPCSPQLDNIQNMEEMQQKEAERRAKLVYEVMIDKAPAAVVGLVGRKEYEQCAKDLYNFIQSSVFMKQLAFELLQLLLLSAFPELDPVFRQLYEEKERFGELKTT